MDGFEKINELFDKDYDQDNNEAFEEDYDMPGEADYDEPAEEDYDEAFANKCGKAEKMLENPDKVEKFLKRLEKKLQKLPVLNDALVYIPKMGLMLNSYIKKQYTEIPIGSIIAILGALLYFVAPIDLIPDIFPGVGYLDDAAMVGAALLLVKSDLDEYMEWRDNNGLGDQFTII